MKSWYLAFVAAALAAPAVAPAAPEPAVNWTALAREILAETVAMRTAAGHGEVPRMARYLGGVLQTGGFAPEDIQITPMGETATLVVRYRSADPLKNKPILILAHMDVVAADPADWVLDPFQLTERDGFLFGRGVQDNKLGVALSVATFVRLRAEGFKPDRDLVLVFSGDEETAQDSTAMLAALPALKEAEYALNTDAGGGELDADGKPLAYFLQAAEKTYASFDVTVRNPGGHSSQPRSDNAIYSLAAALQRIEAHRFPVQVNEITQGYLSAMGLIKPGPVGAAMRRLAENPQDEEAANLLFEQPHLVGNTRTTCVATMLHAGHAENALPQRASATINCRIFPDVDPEDVRQALATAAGPDATVTLINKAFLASASALNETVSNAVDQALAPRAAGVPVIPRMSAGYTDGSFFRAAGVPTYGVGAVFMKPSDSFAHGLNERVPVASLAEGMAHWHRLLTILAN